MQTSFKENSEFFQRIMEIIDYKGIKSVNVFATKHLNYDAPQKINRLKKKENKPSYEIILDIVNKFEEIDANWLISGKGNMLKKAPIENYYETQHPAQGSVAIAAESSVEYKAENWQQKYYELHEKYINVLEQNNNLLQNKLAEVLTGTKSA